jgi:hypothetical protein
LTLIIRREKRPVAEPTLLDKTFSIIMKGFVEEEQKWFAQ